MAGNVHWRESAVAMGGSELSPLRTEMRDVFRFSAPLGVLGRVAEVLVLRRYMQALLLERNAVIREIAESELWRKYVVGL